MIENAITQLKEERGSSAGSSAESISKFILTEYKDLLPWTHATLLKHHLQNLCERGFLVVSDDGFYFLGKETNRPKPASDPDPSLNVSLIHKATGSISSLDYGYESDSTSSSGESFSPIKEREMSKRRKDKAKGKRIWRKGKNVHCRKRGEKRDLVVGIELEQENRVNEEMIDEPQRVVSVNSISRVRTSKQGQEGWKRGRSQKNITTSSNQTPKPRKKLGRPRKKDVNIEEAGKAIMGQDEVLADKQNKQKEDQEFRPKNDVYTMDGDDMANMTRVEQSDEDIVAVDLIIDQVCMELKEEKETKSFTIEDEVIPPRAEEQHRVQVDEDLVNNSCQAEPSAMAIDIVPEEQECDVSTERTESLQKDAHIEETGKSMNITEANGIRDLIEELEFENENQNEPNETIDLVNGDCQAEPITMVIDIALEEQERQVSMERTESLHKDALIEETRMNVAETKECYEEHDANEPSADDQTCLMNDVEFQERESDVLEEENHLKDAFEILEERDEQAITEQNQPEEQECEVSMERTELLQKDAHTEETGKSMNITEANGIRDLIEELEFENENQNEPNETIDLVNGDYQAEPSTMVTDIALEEKERQVSMERTESLQKDAHIEETRMNVTETKECGEERDANEKSVDDQTCLMNDVEIQEQESDVIECDEEMECSAEDQACEVNDVELQEQEYEENKFSGESEEDNHLKDACEFVEERDQQAITERYQPEKEYEVLENFDELCKHGGRTDNEQYPSQKLQEDGVNEGESQQLEEQKQELEMHGEYESLDEALCPSEKEQIDASKEQEENDDVNQQLKEQKQDAYLSQKLQDDGVNEGESQQLEEQKQELEMHEYENLDEAQHPSEKEQNDASKEQEKNEDVNQQLNEQKQDSYLSQKLQEDGVNEGKSQQLEEQKQEVEMHEEYENLDGARHPSEKEQIDASKEQEKNEDVNQHLKEQKQDAVKIGERKRVSEGMMGIEILVEFGERSCEAMLECEQNSVSDKMELESNCGERTNASEQRSDTLSAKTSRKVKSVNVVQQVEKRQLRPRSNKSQLIQSEEKDHVVVPSLEKSSETNQRQKLRVTKQLEQGTRKSLRLQQSRSRN